MSARPADAYGSIEFCIQTTDSQSLPQCRLIKHLLQRANWVASEFYPSVLYAFSHFSNPSPGYSLLCLLRADYTPRPLRILQQVRTLALVECPETPPQSALTSDRFLPVYPLCPTLFTTLVSSGVDETAVAPAAKPTESAKIFSAAVAPAQLEGMDIKEKKRQLFFKDRELNQLQLEAQARQQELNEQIEAAHKELARRESLLRGFKAAHAKQDPEANQKPEGEQGQAADNAQEGVDSAFASVAQEEKPVSADQEDEDAKVFAASGLKMAKNSIIYQQEVFRLQQACDEQQAYLEQLTKSAHAEMRRRGAEITRRAADLRDRQAELVASYLGLDDERQRELIELMDKTKAWEQAIQNDVGRIQEQLRESKKQAKIWKAKFQLRSDELTAAKQIAQVHAATLARALDVEREQNERLRSEYNVALARGVDAVKAEAARVISQTRRDLITEYEAKLEALREEHEKEVLMLRANALSERHALEKKLRDLQESSDQRMEALRTDLTNHHNEVVIQLQADAATKISELEIKLDDERATSQRQREQAEAMAEALMRDKTMYYENRLEDQRQHYEDLLAEERAAHQATREAAAAELAATKAHYEELLATRLDELEKLRQAFDEYKFTLFEEDLRNRVEYAEVVNRLRELEAHEFHRARYFAALTLIEAKPYFGFEVEFIRGSVKVKSIVPNCAASVLGLKAGDSIVQAGGIPIKTKTDFTKVLKATKLGSVLKLVYTRGDSSNQHNLALPVESKYYSVAELIRLQRIAASLVSPVPIPTSAGESAESDVDFVDRMYRRAHNQQPQFVPIAPPESVITPMILGKLPAHASTSAQPTTEFGELQVRAPEVAEAIADRVANLIASKNREQEQRIANELALEERAHAGKMEVTITTSSSSSTSTQDDASQPAGEVSIADVPPPPPPILPLPSEDEDGNNTVAAIPPPSETHVDQDSMEDQAPPPPPLPQDDDMETSPAVQSEAHAEQEVTVVEIDNSGQPLLPDSWQSTTYPTKQENDYETDYYPQKVLQQPEQPHVVEVTNTDSLQDFDIIPTMTQSADDYGDDNYPAPPPVTSATSFY